MEQQPVDEKAHTKLTKPRKHLWNIGLGEYSAATAWVADHLHKKFDFICAKSLFDPESEYWYFYDADGDLLTRVELDLMDRLVMVLKQIEATSQWAVDHGRD